MIFLNTLHKQQVDIYNVLLLRFTVIWKNDKNEGT